ncbi:hypothetical protein L596_002292 [Steinernema carpocapsae]|uniref:Uncharacterized protein n=1 Tax=Steinernema carpocapsae TaxID=34508 RepID=A0A4U8UP62_STECR|nr:hypothetical protein L596_002292 [Steinernema carpocapsae]
MNVSAILSTSGADSAQIDIVEKLQRMLEGIKGLNPALAGTPSPPVTLESNISPKPTTPKAVPPPKPGSLDAAVLRRRAALARDSARNLESCISRLPLPSTSTATTTTTSVAKSSSKTPVTTTTSSSPAATARDDSAPTTSASVDRQPRNSSGSHQRFEGLRRRRGLFAGTAGVLSRLVLDHRQLRYEQCQPVGPNRGCSCRSAIKNLADSASQPHGSLSPHFSYPLTERRLHQRKQPAESACDERNGNIAGNPKKRSPAKLCVA